MKTFLLFGIQQAAAQKGRNGMDCSINSPCCKNEDCRLNLCQNNCPIPTKCTTPKIPAGVKEVKAPGDLTVGESDITSWVCDAEKNFTGSVRLVCTNAGHNLEVQNLCTNNCFIPGKEYGRGYKAIPNPKTVDSAKDCGKECDFETNCKYFTWLNRSEHNCYLKTHTPEEREEGFKLSPNTDAISGPKLGGNCGPVKLLKKGMLCSDDLPDWVPIKTKESCILAARNLGLKFVNDNYFAWPGNKTSSPGCHLQTATSNPDRNNRVYFNSKGNVGKARLDNQVICGRDETSTERHCNKGKGITDSELDNDTCNLKANSEKCNKNVYGSGCSTWRR